MRRLPLLVDGVRAANRWLNELSYGEGPFKGLATRAVDAVSSVRDAVQSRSWPQRPEQISVELTAICDARCIHCPRHAMDRSQRPMEFSLFRKLVDQAAELGVPNLCPNGFGELLTMANLGDYLAYARSTSHRFRILINSNGFRMDEEKRELFLAHQVDFLNVTIDGASAETFESIRPRLKLHAIEENVRELLRVRRERGLEYPKVRVGVIAIPQNAHEVQAVMDKWRGVADYVGVGGFTNRAGSLDNTFTIDDGRSRPKACVLPFKELNIWADGKAVLCCDDWNEEHAVGDLNTSSIAEIWKGPIMSEARRRHAAGRGHELDICARCNMWREPPPTAKLWT